MARYCACRVGGDRPARGVRYRVSLPSEKAGQRRTLDEHLFVRFPALYRMLAERVLRLPPRSRLRRLMIARIVRRGYGAANRRDFDLLVLPLDPDIEYHPRPDLLGPDQEAPVHGRDAYRGMWPRLLDAFEDTTLVPEEVLDLGDKVLVTVQFRGHGSSSGVPISERGYSLFTFRRGLARG